MQIFRSLLLPLLPFFAPFFAFGCAASTDDVSSDESNLDTSGCSASDVAQTKGAIRVSASRPPTASCWNIDASGLSLSYSWTQTNDSTPSKNSVGFYVAINGVGSFEKADAARCTSLPSSGLGHDTSGTRTFTCTTRKQLDFGHQSKMKSAAYGSDGHRVAWDVAVAVALDDHGNWDSLNGANYHFAF